MAIVLRQQELQLELMEWTMKHQSTREWHAKRRIKQRSISPYPSPPKNGRSTAKPHPMRKHASLGVLNSSKGSFRRTSTNNPPSTSSSASTESTSTFHNGKGCTLPISMTSGTHLASVTPPITPSNLTSLPETSVAAMTFDDPWAEFMGLNPSPAAQGTVTMNLGRDLEVNLSMLDHTIDDFFLETIEGAAPQVQTSPRPSTSEVIKGLSFKKTTAAPEPEAMDPLFNTNLIPEVEYETGEGDVDMDVDRSPEPSVIITT
ncbi:hypothetical protein FA13DRAFT_1797381 [Coprinellus micaceus]|uniref:Uncharacterized protein n=1 Tax=Coprinellus micaceus TaxID=71717 RepID=A0A4Y7SR33_COPMI|nr:hypothetical protein FA13DRAFT_1797381 [Coprinellus micaceus]